MDIFKATVTCITSVLQFPEYDADVALSTRDMVYREAQKLVPPPVGPWELFRLRLAIDNWMFFVAYDSRPLVGLEEFCDTWDDSWVDIETFGVAIGAVCG